MTWQVYAIGGVSLVAAGTVIWALLLARKADKAASRALEAFGEERGLRMAAESRADKAERAAETHKQGAALERELGAREEAVTHVLEDEIQRARAADAHELRLRADQALAAADPAAAVGQLLRDVMREDPLHHADGAGPGGRPPGAEDAAAGGSAAPGRPRRPGH